MLPYDSVLLTTQVNNTYLKQRYPVINMFTSKAVEASFSTRVPGLLLKQFRATKRLAGWMIIKISLDAQFLI